MDRVVGYQIVQLYDIIGHKEAALNHGRRFEESFGLLLQNSETDVRKLSAYRHINLTTAHFDEVFVTGISQQRFDISLLT